MNKTLVSALAIVGALGAGGWWYVTQSGSPVVAEAAAQVGATEVHPLDITLGDPNAPIVMVEYSSFTCPHCATFHSGAFEQIKENFIETGQVFYINREVYFDRFGLWAAMVARCGGEDRYHGMIDLIYENQSTWAGSSDPAQVADNLRRLGRQAGMDDAQVNACLEDGEKALELTEFFQQNAETYGIRSTPSFVINGELHTNMAWAEFERLLNSKLDG